MSLNWSTISGNEVFLSIKLIILYLFQLKIYSLTFLQTFCIINDLKTTLKWITFQLIIENFYSFCQNKLKFRYMWGTKYAIKCYKLMSLISGFSLLAISLLAGFLTLQTHWNVQSTEYDFFIAGFSLYPSSLYPGYTVLVFIRFL